MNEFPLLDSNSGIPLFYPYVPREAVDEVADTLSGRWIGQGPKVDKFERDFKSKFLGGFSALSVGSGTDALHLSYLLANIERGDEVLVPVFTCTATNIPLLYIGANPVFVDIDSKTMNLDVNDIERKITDKTKAIVCVDYGGVPNDYDSLTEICKRYNLTLIADAAHSLGTTYKGRPVGQLSDFTVFSFQAIKTLTTGDGGMISIRDANLLEKAKRLRWFGIDRVAKQGGIWENDISEVGFKYQMNDIAASIGLASLSKVDELIAYRNKLFRLYENNLNTPRVEIIGSASTNVYFNSAWMITIVVDSNRIGLMKKLRLSGIESAQVHYRNDRYSIFGGRRDDLISMNKLEDRYLVLPIHHLVRPEDVVRICEIINDGW